MRIFRRRAAEQAERKALTAHIRRSTERQAEIEALQFLLTTIRKRHTWDRIKCTIATAIPAFWILMIALRAYLPTWLHPLLQDVPESGPSPFPSPSRAFNGATSSTTSDASF